MSQILDQAEELRMQAIGLLLTERQEIDHKLTMLGHDGTALEKKTRACKTCGQGGHNAKTCPQATPST